MQSSLIKTHSIVCHFAHVNLNESNGSPFLSNFSKSTMNRDMTFDPVAFFILPKRMNGSDYENGPIESIITDFRVKTFSQISKHP